MAVFSTNQVRHLYVANAVIESTKTGVDLLTNKGDVVVKTDAEGNVFIKHLGAGGVTRTDLINPKFVKSATRTYCELLQDLFKHIEITPKADHTIVAGLDYLLSVVFSLYIGLSDDSELVKYGVAHATTGMTVSTLLKTLAISLAKNLSREPQKTVLVGINAGGTSIALDGTSKITDITGDATSIYIETLPLPWVRGINAGRQVQVTVKGDRVLSAGDEVEWVDIVENYYLNPAGNNSHKVADLEYFCMGDRADLYRGMGWPRIIPTEYLVDPEAEYDVIDIHYATAGTCEDSQLSEKDLTLVAPEAIADTLIAKLAAVGITVK